MTHSIRTRRAVHLTCLLWLALLTGPAHAVAPALPQPVAEEGFQRIGGIEQWITIHGDDRSQPVVLFLHGGPGNPLSPFADRLYGTWTHEFTLVQWDQRGAGKTFGRNPAVAEAPLRLEQMVDDGIAVAEYLVRRLGQPRIALVASSWGSALGVHMIRRRPELFSLYVGSAQLVSQQADAAASYALTLAAVEAAGDTRQLAALKAIGPPPRTDPRAFGVLRRAIRASEARVTDPAPAAWWAPAPAYATPAALAHHEQGEDHSFLQFVGLNNDGMLAQIDLPRLGRRFEVPMVIIQGQEDLLTPLEVTRPWFDSLEAPRKAWIVVPRAGHDPNEAMLAAQRQALRTYLQAPVNPTR